jgi:hypothetical protein
MLAHEFDEKPERMTRHGPCVEEFRFISRKPDCRDEEELSASA